MDGIANPFVRVENPLKSLFGLEILSTQNLIDFVQGLIQDTNSRGSHYLHHEIVRLWVELAWYESQQCLVFLNESINIQQRNA